MATRLYFGGPTLNGAVTAPPVSPTFDAAWESTGSAVRRSLEATKLDNHDFESLAVANATNTPSQAVDVLIAQYTSAPLSGAQTISGAIKGQIRAQESNAAADLDMQCVIWVRKSDGTSRGTLIAVNTAALSNEFNTSLRNIKIPKGGSTVPTSVNAQTDDRIVVEIGYRKHENATTSRTGTFDSGNPSGTDLAEDETTTTQNVPWIEFADTLTFAATPARASQVVHEVAVIPTPDIRASQVVHEVAIVPTPAIRTSQVVHQVALSGYAAVATGGERVMVLWVR